MNAEVHESFGRAAARYDAHAPVQVAMADWLAEWLPEAREGAALEMGAGTGIFTERVASWRGRYMATDASAAMVEQGARRHTDREWGEARAEAPPAGPWAWMFSSSMLQWVERPAAVLRGWRETLALDGRVLVGFYVAETLPELDGLLGGAGPLEWRTPWAWREAFRVAGLRIVRDEISRRRFKHPSARALLRSLHGTGVAPRRLVSPARLLGWLREREGLAMEATWTFYRCEAEKMNGLSENLP